MKKLKINVGNNFGNWIVISEERDKYSNRIIISQCCCGKICKMQTSEFFTRKSCRDRINNNKGYYKKNCRWVTHKENGQNTRKCYFWYIDGIKYNSSREAAIALNVSKGTIEKHILNKNKPQCYKISKY